LQIAPMVAAVALVVKQMGLYVALVFEGKRNLLTPVVGPVEGLFFVASGADRDKEQGWLAYTLSMLAFSVAAFVILYLILRSQDLLPFNPQGFDGVLRLVDPLTYTPTRSILKSISLRTVLTLWPKSGTSHEDKGTFDNLDRRENSKYVPSGLRGPVSRLRAAARVSSKGGKRGRFSSAPARSRR
jgi:hypothetical protein